MNRDELKDAIDDIFRTSVVVDSIKLIEDTANHKPTKVLIPNVQKLAGKLLVLFDQQRVEVLDEVDRKFRIFAEYRQADLYADELSSIIAELKKGDKK